MAEVEHFVDPEGGKGHSRFDEIKDIHIDLLDRHTQLAGKTDIQTMTIGDAVEKRVVDNETLGYFLARIYSCSGLAWIGRNCGSVNTWLMRWLTMPRTAGMLNC